MSWNQAWIMERKITENYLLAGKCTNRKEITEERKYNFFSHQKNAVQNHNKKIRKIKWV